MAVWPTLRNFGRLGLTTISRRGAASEASKPTRTHKEIVDYVERETKNVRKIKLMNFFFDKSDTLSEMEMAWI